MLYLGFEPGAAGWQEQMDQLSYGGRPLMTELFKRLLASPIWI